jgi:hypothetical protein
MNSLNIFYYRIAIDFSPLILSLTAPECSMSVFDRSMRVSDSYQPFVIFKRPEILRNCHETSRNGQERWTFRKGERSGTLDGLKCSYCTK